MNLSHLQTKLLEVYGGCRNGSFLVFPVGMLKSGTPLHYQVHVTDVESTEDLIQIEHDLLRLGSVPVRPGEEGGGFDYIREPA